jgi:hypothetical protein
MGAKGSKSLAFGLVGGSVFVFGYVGFKIVKANLTESRQEEEHSLQLPSDDRRSGSEEKQ